MARIADGGVCTPGGLLGLLQQLEGAEHLLQPLGLLSQGLGRAGALFGQRGVVALHAVELLHRFLHRQLRCGRPAVGRLAHLGDDLRGLLHRGQQGLHGGPGVLLQRLRNGSGAAISAGLHQRADLAGRLRGSLRQAAHVGRSSGCRTALTAAGRLDRRIERQQVGLEGDAVDDGHDLGDAPAGGTDVFNVSHHL